MFLTLQIFSSMQVHLQIYFYFYSTHLWTSSGKVALNISVWRLSFCGMSGKDTSFFISAPKPISSMRSASSSTKYFTFCKPICKYFSQRKTLLVHWQYTLTKCLNCQNLSFTYFFQVSKKWKYYDLFTSQPLLNLLICTNSSSRHTIVLQNLLQQCKHRA